MAVLNSSGWEIKFLVPFQPARKWDFQLVQIFFNRIFYIFFENEQVRIQHIKLSSVQIKFFFNITFLISFFLGQQEKLLGICHPGKCWRISKNALNISKGISKSKSRHETAEVQFCCI
jgi:hypothetical protein